MKLSLYIYLIYIDLKILGTYILVKISITFSNYEKLFVNKKTVANLANYFRFSTVLIF